jgi:hypothetical protein
MVVGVTIATITYLVIGGSGSSGPSFSRPDDLWGPVNKHVGDPERRARALALVQEAGEKARATEAHISATVERYAELVREWETTAYALDTELFSPLDEQRREAVAELVRIRHELRELLTPAEWKKIFG